MGRLTGWNDHKRNFTADDVAPTVSRRRQLRSHCATRNPFRGIQILVYSPLPLKPLRWLGSSLEDVRAFPEDARRQAGYELFQIRIEAGTAYRVFYVAKFPEAIYVIHGFEKRTQQTPRADIDLARKRLGDLKRVRLQRRRKK
jgi:phage-related protein